MAPPDYPPGGRIGDYLLFWLVWLLFVVGTVWFVRRMRGRRGALRLVVGNLLVLATLLWTVVVAAETCLRWVVDTTDSYGLTLTNWSWMSRHVLLNSKGFREREFDWEKPPGRERVVFTGDSFTVGWGVKRAQDTYPARVGETLERRSPGRFDVIDLAVIGADTGAHVEQIEQILRVSKVDRFVLGYCLNDIDDLVSDDVRFLRDRAERPAWLVANRSFVADWLWFHLRLRGDARVRSYFGWVQQAYDDPKTWGRQADRFARIATSCRLAGVRIDVMVFPFFHEWGPDYPWDSCHVRIAQAWERLGVRVIDLREAYRGIPGSELVVNRFDAHPNERAHEIAARVVLDRLFDVK